MVFEDRTVLPFEGDAGDGETLGLDWSRCVVRVENVSGIPGLPQRLRGMTQGEYRRRRAACRGAFRRVMGSRAAVRRSFFALLRARVGGAAGDDGDDVGAAAAAGR